MCLAGSTLADLHTTVENEQNYLDFVSMIVEANANLAGKVDFAVLPGDNAEDGTPEQFRFVRQAVNKLEIPLHILPGDHDRKQGSLDFFHRVRGAGHPKSVEIDGYRCLFLDVVSAGAGDPDFRLGPDQFSWLEHELASASAPPRLLHLHAFLSRGFKRRLRRTRRAL